MTDPKQDQAPSPAILHAQLAGLLAEAQAQLNDLQSALAGAEEDAALCAQLRDAATRTAGVIGALSQALASPAGTLRQMDITALQGLVRAGETASLLSIATARQSSATARLETVAAASAATGDTTRALAHDIFSQRMFAPYMRFTSAEEEDAFRDREAKARAYIEAQLGRGTPEGNLNAGAGMAGYMLDAHAHGAGNSPDFLPRWNSLVDKLQHQRAAMRAAGQSTEECDRSLRASVRHYLGTKTGLSDIAIDARLDRAVNPLEAVTPFLRNDHASRKLEETARIITATARTKPEDLPRVERMDAAAAPATPVTIDPDAMHARLKAAGILIGDTAEPVSGHGLTAQKPAGRSRPGPAG